jgi:hypothetical protein
MHDYNIFAEIKKLMMESHTKEQIKALSTSELKKLHKEYMEKGTDEAVEEAAIIKKEIESRGEEKTEVTEGKDEELAAARKWYKKSGSTGPFEGATPTDRYLLEMYRREMKKSKSKSKSNVAQQNEELLAILNVLCEMAGLDMETLMEETREEMENLGRAYGWDKPAPEGTSARDARLARVKANMRRLGKRSKRVAADQDAFRTGDKFVQSLVDAGRKNLGMHEPTAKKRMLGRLGLPGGVDKPVHINDPAFDEIQNSIKGLLGKGNNPKPTGKPKGKKKK